MSRGRDKFRRVKPVLLLLASVLRLLPPWVSRGLWGLSEGLAGSIGIGIRYAIAKRLSGSIGDNVLFGKHVYVSGWENFYLGSNVSVHRGCYVDAVGGISIGNDVSIAHSTSILSFEHTWGIGQVPIKDNPLQLMPVIVDDDVWIGCGVRILGGCCLGRRSVVAAGAVVKGRHHAGSVLAGVPAKLVKAIDVPENGSL